MGRDGWIYQGRQYRQWFGHGTKSDERGMVPSKLDERIRSVGLTAIAALRPDERRHPAATFDPASLDQLDHVMTALIESLEEPAQEVTQRLLGTDASNPVAQHLRRAAKLIARATTTADMQKAAHALADGMRAVGLDRWRFRLNEVAGQVLLAANADDPRGNNLVRDIARSLGMSAQQRQMLHREISGEHESGRD